MANRRTDSAVVSGTDEGAVRSDRSGNPYIPRSRIWVFAARFFLALGVFCAVAGLALLLLDAFVSAPGEDFSGGQYLLLLGLPELVAAFLLLRMRYTLTEHHLVHTGFGTRRIALQDLVEGAREHPPEILQPQRGDMPMRTGANTVRFSLPDGGCYNMLLGFYSGGQAFLSVLQQRTGIPVYDQLLRAIEDAETDT